ncbi:MAG: hypothetical protein QM742_11320 [Aquabacterium sp.]
MSRKVRALAWACACAGMVGAHASEPLPDEALSGVAGRDGLAFNLKGFELDGPLTFTYTSPDAGHPSLWLGQLHIARSDDPDPEMTFNDPYRLNIYRRIGMADVIEWANPLNANGAQKWQFAANFGVQADGVRFDGGSVILKDLVLRAGGLSISTPADPAVQGVAFGYAIRADIGHLMIRAAPAWRHRPGG